MSYIEETSTEKALEFLFSHRGRYIMSQALYYALKELQKVEPDVYQEKSNISDMEYLRKHLFDYPDMVFEDFRRKVEA